jgi:hypothetical protein
VLTVRKGSIVITRAAHFSLCDFMNLTVFSVLIKVFNSAFVLILHVPSLSYVGPYVFLRTLRSKTNRPFCSVTDMVHVSQPYITVGLIMDLYICK